MTRDFKTFLLWLLLAVLPVQGFAAAMQVTCQPVHGGESGRNTSVAATTGTAPHHEAMISTPDHASMHAQHAAATPDSETSDQHHQQDSTCSACAACCIGAIALSAFPQWPPHHAGSEAVSLSPPQLVAGFIPAGLERPPRLSA